MSDALPPRTARLARLTAALCRGDRAAIRAERLAAPAGEPDRAWREAVLQAHLFAGFPRLVEAYGVLAEAGGLGTPDPEEVEGPAPDPARGAALFDRIYGPAAPRVRASLEAQHPDHARFIAEHAYARVLARPGLDAATRELLAVAALVATGQDRQLASHARGAVRCGASPAACLAVVEALEGRVDAALLERGREVVEHFARPDPPLEPLGDPD